MSLSRWIGRGLTALVALFLAWDGIIKLTGIAPVTDSFVRLGYRTAVAVPLGVLELVLLVLCLVPRTRLFGAVLMTGYLGGAVASHVRVGDPLATHALFPVYVGLLLWGGLLLRDPGARILLGGLRVDFAPSRSMQG